MPKVLIVDDDADVRACLQDALEARGLSCWAVENGRHALECLRAAEVDLIVTDYRMPAMDGLELLRRLTGSALETIPVILLSADSAANLRQEALRLGAYAVVHKPFNTHDLVEVMFRALHRNSSDPEQATAATQPNQGGNYETEAAKYKRHGEGERNGSIGR